MIFRQATLRLTATYTVVQLSLFAIFALGIYFFVTGSFDVEAVSKGGDGPDPEVILLRNGLIIFYASLLLILPISSWLMAKAALRPIRESFDRQRAFIDGASHEIRTPLSVIQGELELALSRARTGAQYREAIESALDATVELSRLSNALLKLSSSSNAELASSFTSVNIQCVVDAAIADVASTADRAGVTVETAGQHPGTVKGSYELLVRAVANVLENAVKFSPVGGVVSVTTTLDLTHLLIRVHDDGHGMSPAEARRAFERFWRADTARSTPGHGLGLALVQQIISGHGGSATIDSTPGAGSTVTLRLPLATS